MEYLVPALAVFVAAALAGSPAWLQLLAWRHVEARRIVVNLKSGQAIDGHLIRRRGPLLFIRNANLHEGTGDPVPLDGEVIIDRSEVDFIQAP